MIHFAQAVRGQSDLGRLMVKQMGEALESAQPEAFTEAMFKLAALLISSKGVAAHLRLCCQHNVGRSGSKHTAGPSFLLSRV